MLYVLTFAIWKYEQGTRNCNWNQHWNLKRLKYLAIYPSLQAFIQETIAALG